MKNLSKKISVSLLVFTLGISNTSAVVELTGNALTFRVITLSGPADVMPYETQIATVGISTMPICYSMDVNYTLAKLEYEPVVQWGGRMTSNGLYLYDLSTPGFMVAPIGSSYQFNAEYPPLLGSGITISMPPEKKIAWTGNLPNDVRLQRTIRIQYSGRLYRGADRPTGVTFLPEEVLFRYKCYDDKGILQEVYNYIINRAVIVSNIRGCTPNSTATTVNMDNLPIARLEKADASTLINSKSQTFSLQCDPDVNVYASFVDLNDPTNTTTTATLSADSTASGVGYSVSSISSNERYIFGPDGSAKDTPGVHQYFIRNSGNNFANPVSFQVNFSYVRKPEEPIKAGSAKSLIGITYSYQ